MISRSFDRAPEASVTATGAPARRPSGGPALRRLRVVFGPDAASPGFVLAPGGSWDIGRAPHVEGPFALADREVSRCHARVVVPAAEGAAVVEDAGSRNGTFVGGLRTSRAELTHGSVLRVGQTILVYLEETLRPEARLAPVLGGLQGESLAIQALRGEIELVGPRSLPVLVLGETGVGKEVVAAAIHRVSGRPGAYVPVNCAALPAALAESELFGHVRGAFSGADRPGEGLFVAAEGGTLFLDEVGELPEPLQAKLLRALATGEIRPVGATQSRRIDVRIVAATHRDLEARSQAGTFRADLLARLAGWTLRVPPLRDRPDDILLLARAFLERVTSGAVLTADAAEALLLSPWPFNVRGLERAMEQAAVRAGGEPVDCRHLPAEISSLLGARGSTSGPVEPPLEVLAPRDRAPDPEGLRAVVQRLGGNMEEVARYFGKDRRQIYRWLERFGLDPDTLRAGPRGPG